MTLWSCESETYETGDGKLSYMRADFAMAYTDRKPALYRAETDEGTQLTFSEPISIKWAAVPDSVYRALVYYNNKVEDGKVEVKVVSQVLTMYPVKPGQLKTLHTDPLTCESIWLSKDNSFLNLGLYLKTGTPDDSDARQTVGVVRDTVMTWPSGHRLHEYTLLHNQSTVPEYYSVRLWASVHTEGLEPSDTILLHVNTYEGMQERRLLVE